MDIPTDQLRLKDFFARLSLLGAFELLGALSALVGVGFTLGYQVGKWPRPAYVMNYHCDPGLELTIKSNPSGFQLVVDEPGSGSIEVPGRFSKEGNLHYSVRGPSGTGGDCTTDLMALGPNGLCRRVYEHLTLAGGEDKDGKDLVWK